MSRIPSNLLEKYLEDMINNSQEKHYTATQVGNMLGKTKDEVIYMLKKGEIKGKKIGDYRWFVTEKEYNRLKEEKERVI